MNAAEEGNASPPSVGERTLLAWVRTGVAVMILGAAIVRFRLRAESVASHDVSLGLILIVLGSAAPLVGAWRFAAPRRGKASLGRLVAPVLFALGVSVLGLLLAATLWRFL